MFFFYLSSLFYTIWRKRRWLSKTTLLANLLPRALLTKKPENSGYEIAYSALDTKENKLFFFSSTHDRMWARRLSLISSIKTFLHHSDSTLKSPVLWVRNAFFVFILSRKMFSVTSSLTFIIQFFAIKDALGDLRSVQWVKCYYLYFTAYSVLDPIRTCEAVRYWVAGRPLIGILPSLRDYFSDGGGISEIDLQPFFVVTCLCTPGSCLTRSGYQVQTAEMGCVGTAVNGRRSHGAVLNSTIFDSKRHGTKVSL